MSKNHEVTAPVAGSREGRGWLEGRGVWVAGSLLSLLGLASLGACGGERLPVGDSPMNLGGSSAGTSAGGTGTSSGGTVGSGGAAGSGGATVSLDCGADGGSGGMVGQGGSAGQGGEPEVDSSCPCSRRSSIASRYCPRGTCQSVTTMIGPEGGTAYLDGTPATLGGPVKVVLPPFAVDEVVPITITETLIPPPEGYVDYSPVYRIEPLGVSFAQATELAIPWENAFAATSNLVGPLVIYGAETADGPFEPVAENYQNAGFNQATLTHGGYFFVGMPHDETTEHCP